MPPENTSLGKNHCFRNDSSFLACPALFNLMLEVLDGDQLSKNAFYFSEFDVCHRDEYCHITNENYSRDSVINIL